MIDGYVIDASGALYSAPVHLPYSPWFRLRTTSCFTNAPWSLESHPQQVVVAFSCQLHGPAGS
jgi:hypothetical protein